MAVDFTSAVHDCVHCAKNRACLHKQSKPSKLFPAFELLESVATDDLVLLHQSWRDFPYIIVVANRFFKLAQELLLRRFRPVDIAQSFLGH